MRLFRRRSSVTGEYVSAADAAANPDTTVTEQAGVHQAASALIAALRATGDYDRLLPLSRECFNNLAGRL